MLIADVYRYLAGEEKILPGDQFKFGEISDEHWGPCDLFVGHRVREFQPAAVLCLRIQFRRLIAHETQ